MCFCVYEHVYEHVCVLSFECLNAHKVSYLPHGESHSGEEGIEIEIE